jgi:hypothetical protein
MRINFNRGSGQTPRAKFVHHVYGIAKDDSTLFGAAEN